MIKISYVSKRVEKCMQDSELIKRVGLQPAKRIRLRLNQIGSALTLAEYLGIGLGKPHSLSADKKGQYGVSVSANYRIIFFPVFSSDNVELDSVKEIEIIGVGDYHGGKVNWIIP